MIRLAFVFLTSIIVHGSFNFSDTEKEKAVKVYYKAFESHDWNIVAGQFAEDFTFTSPNGDDHISLAKFKEKCWPTNAYIKKVNLVKMTETGDEVVLLVELATTDNKIVRNIDVFSFKAGKIKSIEVFFGLGQGYPH